MPNKPTPPNKNNTPRKLRDLRHYARHCALQALYQHQLSGTSISEIEAEFIKEQIRKEIDLEYFKELLTGVLKHQKEIDACITPHLSRAMSDIDPIEMAVLRIAVYELIKRPDVPYRIVINEALELTKAFGSIEGYKFVNGILDKAARQTRTVETSTKKT